jgi:hypothetical protein
LLWAGGGLSNQPCCCYSIFNASESEEEQFELLQ